MNKRVLHCRRIDDDRESRGVRGEGSSRRDSESESALLFGDADGRGKTGAISINVWPDATTAGAPLCQTVSSTTNVVCGRFRIALDSACKIAINKNNGAYVEVIDGATSLGRAPIGAVPYAVEADQAVSATTAVSASTAADAGHASTADNAANLTSSAWQLVPLMSTTTLTEWTANGYGTGLQYRNVGDGTCLRGLLVVPEGQMSGSFATLPSGSRPNQSAAFSSATSSGTAASVQITESETLSLTASIAADWISFDGICFQTAS